MDIQTSHSLEAGFYLVDGSGNLKTKVVRTKAHGEIEVPIRLRTINAAKDFVSCLDGCAVLCVTAENFAWGE